MVKNWTKTQHKSVWLKYLLQEKILLQSNRVLILADRNNPMLHIHGLVQERHNSIATALELHLSCTNPAIWSNQPIIKWLNTRHCYPNVVPRYFLLPINELIVEWWCSLAKYILNTDSLSWIFLKKRDLWKTWQNFGPFKKQTEIVFHE